MTYFSKRMFYLFIALLGLGLLGGCTSAGPSAPIQTIKEMADVVWPGDPKILEIKKGPYRYLHAQLGKKMAVLVLGRIEKTPEGLVQVWYGADGLTFKLNEQGRIVGVWGLSVEWTAVHFFYPVALTELRSEQTYTRMRDEMPGHYVGMKESVTVRPISQVPDVVRSEFKSQAIQWYEEVAEVKGGSRGETLQAYYGWYKKSAQARAEWVYGYQCLAKDLCLTWFKEPKEVFQ